MVRVKLIKGFYKYNDYDGGGNVFSDSSPFEEISEEDLKELYDYVKWYNRTTKDDYSLYILEELEINSLKADIKQGAKKWVDYQKKVRQEQEEREKERLAKLEQKRKASLERSAEKKRKLLEKLKEELGE